MRLKRLLKLILNCTFIVLNAPFLILYFILRPISRLDDLFSGFSQFYSLIPGQVGNYSRRNFYRFTMARCGKDVVIGFGTLFSQQGIEIGNNVFIGPQCNIGLCEIGSESLIGSGVHILSGKNQHNFSDPDIPIKDQGGKFIKISVGENCWLGNQAIIMANVGDRSVIAAGIAVTEPIPRRKIAVANNRNTLIDIRDK